jgi:membrane protein YdbS with pleckstrin-like domain
MEKLHPGAKWLFRLSGYFGAFILMFVLSWILAPIVGIVGGLIFGVGNIGGIILIGLVVYIALIIVFAEIYARMAYNRWFYEFTPTNLKIEKGIIWKKYSNIPYERVQNVDIHRGIIARMNGFSSVAIQTAGLSYSRRGGAGAEGAIPAVTPAAAEKIREFLMKKISKSHSGPGM